MEDRNTGVLLVRFGGLGDLMVALPAMAYLRRTMPGRQFTLLCRGEYGGLFLDSGEVDRVVALEGRAGSLLFGGSPDPDTSPFLNGIGLITAWTQKPLDLTVSNSLEIRRQARFQLIVSPFGLSLPVSRFFYDRTRDTFPADPRGGTDFEECARLSVGERVRVEARAIIGSLDHAEGRYAVVHPGSGGTAKCWALANFLEIIRGLAGKGIAGVLVTGEAEERAALAGRLETEPLARGWTWLRCPSLSSLAGILAGASFYVGNDSGVTHLAAACGTRVLALFREEELPVWRPFGRARIVSASDPAELDAGRVWKELELFFLRSSASLL